MRRTLMLLCLMILASTTLATLARAQAAAPAPPTPARELLNTWNRIGRDVVDVAEAMPEEKYSYKPTPEVRSFAEQLLHVAGANYLFIDAAKGQKPGAEDLSPEKYRTKADIVKVLRESYEAGAALIGQATDAQMNEALKSPFGGMMTREGYWYSPIRHAAEHYGQMVVYLRLNGIVPPATARAQARQQPTPPPAKK